MSPACRCAKPELVARHPGAGPEIASPPCFDALADGVEDAASKMGLASLLKTHLGRGVRGRARRPLHQRPRPRQHPEGRARSPSSRASTAASPPPTNCVAIADVANKYNVPMVKLTGGQRIDLLGIKKDDLPDVWKDLGMPSGHAYAKSFRTCKTCVGTDFCRYGVGDSTGLGIKIEQRFQGIESPGKMKLATAGCPRNCSEAHGQGRGRGRRRGRQVGDLRRRRGGRAHPQGRPALRRGHRTTTCCR